MDDIQVIAKLHDYLDQINDKINQVSHFEDLENLVKLRNLTKGALSTLDNIQVSLDPVAFQTAIDSSVDIETIKTTLESLNQQTTTVNTNLTNQLTALTDLGTRLDNIYTLILSNALPSVLRQYRNFGEVNLAVVKNTPGRIFSIVATNPTNGNNNKVRYVQLFNSATLPTAGTVATDSFKLFGEETLRIGLDIFSNRGLSYDRGICVGISTSARTLNLANANDLHIFIQFS